MSRAALADDGASLVAERLFWRRPTMVYRVTGMAKLDPAKGITSVTRRTIGTAERCGVHPRRFHLLAVDGERLTDWRSGLAMCGGDCTSLTDGMHRLWKHDRERERASS
jgi:hypothetical protein